MRYGKAFFMTPNDLFSNNGQLISYPFGLNILKRNEAFFLSMNTVIEQCESRNECQWLLFEQKITNFPTPKIMAFSQYSRKVMFYIDL